MNIFLGTATSESTFTNVIVATSRRKATSRHILIDGSVKVQEAPEIKRVFTVTLVKPTSDERTNLETEYDKSIILNFIFNDVTYTVRFLGNLERSTGRHSISFILQEI